MESWNPASALCLRDDVLQGKIAWITGGGSGLGQAMAERFAALGAHVVVSGRRPEPLAETVQKIESAGGRALALPMDVRDPEAVQAALDELVAQTGGLDILVNNAAGNFICPTEDLTPNGFNSVVSIVLHGTFYCTQAVGKYWIANKRRGAVLSIATTYAWTGSAFVVPSACAKAGVLAMTRSLAVEWGRYDIRLNAIAPGPIPTEGAFSRLMASPEAVEKHVKHIPAGRLGTKPELAELAAYLVSDASHWVRGEVVTLDGGEWLHGAGEFNRLLHEPKEVWDVFRSRSNKKGG